jgi:hypothetical protein
MQDGEKIELLARNREKGVEIRAPKSPDMRRTNPGPPRIIPSP